MKYIIAPSRRWAEVYGYNPASPDVRVLTTGADVMGFVPQEGDEIVSLGGRADVYLELSLRGFDLP